VKKLDEILRAFEDGALTVTEATTLLMSVRTSAFQADFAVVPSMPCPHCHRSGVVYVEGPCVSCGDAFSGRFCMQSFLPGDGDAQKLMVNVGALLCGVCRERENDTPVVPPSPRHTAPRHFH